MASESHPCNLSCNSWSEEQFPVNVHEKDEDVNDDSDGPKIESEAKRRKTEFSARIKAALELLDTSGATILKVDGHKFKLTNRRLFSELVRLSWQCRHKRTLNGFDHPGDEEDCDGGLQAIENNSFLSDEENQLYSNKARIAIQQYNDSITNNNNNNQQSKLEFSSFIRAVVTLGFRLFMTFSAYQNGQLGTYQAVVANDWRTNEDAVYLILLRHVEADKILAVMSLLGAEEELKKYDDAWAF